MGDAPPSGLAVARGAFDFGERDVVAGAPLRVTFTVRNDGASALFLAVGSERFAVRPSGFEVRGRLRAAGTRLEDPFADRAGWGGPSTAVEIGPGERRECIVLVNQFLRLELLAELLGPGAEDRLELDCRHVLSYAGRIEDVFGAHHAEAVSAAASIRVRRDDRALDDAVRGLAERVLRADGPVEREQAMTELCSLRVAPARAALVELARHPDAAISGHGLLRAALAAERGGDAAR